MCDERFVFGVYLVTDASAFACPPLPRRTRPSSSARQVFFACGVLLLDFELSSGASYNRTVGSPSVPEARLACLGPNLFLHPPSPQHEQQETRGSDRRCDSVRDFSGFGCGE